MTLKIVHKRLNAIDGSDKAVPPTAADLEIGEIGINYSEEVTLFIKDEADNIVRVVGGSSVVSDVVGGDGITITDADEKVIVSADPNVDKGIEIHTGKIAAKPSATEGISFNANGELKAQINTDKGLEFDSGNIANIGAGLEFDAGGQITAKIGIIITIDGGGEITADVAGIIGGNGITATKDARQQFHHQR